MGKIEGREETTMLRKRFVAALLSLCLVLGLYIPAYAEETDSSLKTAAQTEGPDNTAGPYAPDPVKPGEMTLAAPRAGSVSYPVEGGNLYFDPETGTVTGCDETVTSADIPGGVTSIGNSAFRECSSLAGVTIPDGVTSIGGHAFEGCSSLTCVTIPGSVTFIGSNAFRGCSGLTSVTIPDSVTSIGGNPFSSCRRLTQVTASSGNPAFISVNGVLFNKAKASLLCYPAGKQGDSPSIPDGVTSIGGSAFEGCSNLTSVIIPDGVTSIDCYAFQGCSSLASVTIPDSVTSIEIDAFRECSSLTSVIIPSTVASISDYTFYGCSGLTSLTISEGVTSIGNSAFEYCSGLSSVTIPDGVTSIGNSAFGHCSRLADVTIPDSVAFIDCDAFRGCFSLASAAIPDGVKSIEAHTFNGCSSLASVTIPISVTSIGVHAFAFCDRLTAICYGGGEEKWEALLSNSSVEIPETAVVYFNGQRPAPTVSVVGSPVQTGSVTTVQTTPMSLSAILPASGKAPIVLAAPSSGGAASGAADTDTGEITFHASLKSGDKLFFLDPDTFIPLAMPAVLK